MEYTIYGRPSCPHCVEVKNDMEGLKFSYVFKEIGKDISLDDFKAQYPYVSSIPFIVDSEGSVYGYKEIRERVIDPARR